MKSDGEAAITTSSVTPNENISTNKPPATEDIPMSTVKQEDSGKKPVKKRLTRGAPTSSDADEPMKQPTHVSSEEEDQGLKRQTGKKKRQMIEESDDDGNYNGQPDIENKNAPNVQVSQ